ncbi:MAG: glycosyltransferase family 1 protein [bacterium]|nr:glycosyltransferase family 1 protein [bacterium]
MRPPEIRTSTTKIEVPVQFSRLLDIAYNLWWCWTPSARELFRMIDPLRWDRYRNPIELLIKVEPAIWRGLQNERAFIRAYLEVVREFDDYVLPEVPTWFDRSHGDHDRGPIVYFSTEFGWHESLQVYSGGLGILSGDHCKSASDLGLPFIGIGLMYRHGYFRQTVDAEGNQQHFYPDHDLQRMPLLPVVDAEERELQISLELDGREIHCRVWKAAVGRVDVLLLDTDVPNNHPADRAITSALYVSGREMRLCQELILGLGGVQLVEKLGLRPSVWHMNEGHSALLSLGRLADNLAAGASFEDALEQIRSAAVFTTHTPVPAGNEVFDEELVRKYVTGWASAKGLDAERLLQLGRDPRNGDDERTFNMTVLALRTSRAANGVSELHGQIAGTMWNDLLHDGHTIEHVTNGVHVPTWLGPEVGRLLGRYVGPHVEERSLDPDFESAVNAIPDEELWDAHMAQKRRTVELSRANALQQRARHGRSPDELRETETLLDPDALLVGFARRFATYKRADLLLRDVERLKSMAGADGRPVQFLFAGKAHPADRPGQELIRRIYNASLDPELRGRLLFLENYDMTSGRFMVQGVDIWLNNPRRPQEASGTSGMKAAINGGLNCSILDGWWCEGYDPSHGWTIAEERDDHGEHQDERDAESLYHVFEQQIVPCYYERDSNGIPVGWVHRMKAAIAQLTPRFSSARMVREYTDNFYLASRRTPAEPSRS